MQLNFISHKSIKKLASDRQKVIYNQLELHLKQSNYQQQEYRVKITHIQNEIRLNRLKITILTRRTQNARQEISKALQRLTPEICSEIGKIETPSRKILYFSSKFLLIFNIKHFQWSHFAQLMEDYALLTEMFRSINSDQFNEQLYKEMRQLWRHKETFIKSFQRISVGLVFLLDFILSHVELRVIKDDLHRSQLKQHKLEKESKKLMRKLEKYESKAKKLARTLKTITSQTEFKKREEMSYFDEKSLTWTKDQRDILSQSVLSPSLDMKIVKDLDEQALHYNDSYDRELEDTFAIKFEGPNELKGCCGGRLFCLN